MPSSPPSAPHADPRAARGRTLLAALMVATLAFLLYRATLLPGVDLGDSGSFQTMVGSPYITPRDAYPLYFAIGAGVLKLTGAEPAYALNLTSAIEGAIACGLFVLAATALTGSLGAAVAGAVLFGVSYTFWSQAVTAEVYALHIALVLASILLLLRWEERPTNRRLAAFFACYAIAFGNHLTMIVLAPAFAVFLLLAAPRGWRSILEPRAIALAVGFAVLGALQYAWNFRTLWFLPDQPAGVRDALQRFWFDVTKSDWRDSMLMQVPASMRTDHLAMYWFDLRQQFGIVGVTLAIAGIAWLFTTRPRRARLLVLLFGANVAFAFNYNVGDAHVFYLPSHVIVALLAAAGVAALAADRRVPRLARVTAVTLAIAYGVARGYHDYPALDRSADRRAADMLTSLTDGLDDQDAILLVDLNWQIANGLSYFTHAVRPEVATARMQDVLPYAPALIEDNLASGRLVALTERARDLLIRSYGARFQPAADFSLPHSGPVSDLARALLPGTRYALCILKPTRDYVLNRADLDTAVRILSPASAVEVPREDYAVIAGVAGQTPVLVAESNLPFAHRTVVGDVPVEVRMESWLAADTIRRMGFGHVIAARRHTLIVERGISFVTFDRDGAPLSTAYVGDIFERPRRYLIRTDMVR